MKHVTILSTFVVGFLMITPLEVNAQVIINEIYPNPNTGEDEWVELYNPDTQAIDLLDWKLWDLESSPGIAYDFAQSIMLESHGFFVLSLHNILNNTGDTLLLKNPQDELIDTFGYTSSAKGFSWARNPGNFATLFQASPTKGETNLAPTPTPTPTPTSNQLLPQLSEVMACPDDAAEWVELSNPHGSELTLLGFSLRDSRAKILGFTDEKLQSKEYVAFELRNVLNNGGDTVSLISPSNQVIDSFSYTQCEATLSWVKKGIEWKQTAIITPNSANIYSDLQSSEATNAAAVTQAGENLSAGILGISTNNFTYPLSVLKPKLTYDHPEFPISQNIVFSEPAHLERGALSVIMGSFLLLIPGFVLYATKQQIF